MAYKNTSYLICTKVIYTDLALWVEPNFKSNKMLEYCQCPFPSLFTGSSRRNDTILCFWSCRWKSAACLHQPANILKMRTHRYQFKAHKYWVWWEADSYIMQMIWSEQEKKTSLLCRLMKNFQHHGQLSGCGPDSTFSWHLPALLLHIEYRNLSYKSLTPHFSLVMCPWLAKRFLLKCSFFVSQTVDSWLPELHVKAACWNTEQSFKFFMQRLHHILMLHCLTQCQTVIHSSVRWTSVSFCWANLSLLLWKQSFFI